MYITYIDIYPRNVFRTYIIGTLEYNSSEFDIHYY